ILGERRDMVVERIEAGGGEDARLPHRTAEYPAGLHGAGDVGGAAGDDAADRAAEALRQCDRCEIERPRQFGKADARRDRRIEEAGAVEITSDAARARRLADGGDLALLPHDAAAEIVRVFDRDEPARRQNDMAARFDGGAEILDGEAAAL